MRSLFLVFLFILPWVVVAQTHRNELVYVHTDKSLYVPGEILWFKPYVLDEATNTPLFESSVVYVELIDAQGHAIWQGKVANNKESGGSWFIDSTTPTGKHTLVAYTHKMKQQGLHFSKEITIIHPFVPRPASNAASNYDFQVFPEGGYLLEDVPSRLAYKLLDPTGNGKPHTVTVFENNKEIATSLSNAFGMGYLQLPAPKPGVTYRAVAAVAGQQIAALDLPKARSTGAVLHAFSEGEQYRIQVITTEYQPLSIRYQAENNAVTYQKLTLDNQRRATFLLPKHKLAYGSSCLSLVNEHLEPISERVVFRMPADTLKISPHDAPSALPKRARNQWMFHIPDAAEGSFSVAIRQKEGRQDDLFTTLYLRKNVQGPVEFSSYYFSTECTDEDRESLLLTQGWRTLVPPDLPEQRYHRIEALFSDKETLRPLAHEAVLLSVPGTPIRVFPSVTDSAGKATFFVKNLYGSLALALRALSGKHAHVELISPFAKHPPYPAGALPEITEEDLIAKAIYSQAQNLYFGKERATADLHMYPDSVPFYGQADATYRLDDYTRFVLMEEVLREYVKEIRLRKTKEEFDIRMLDQTTNTLFRDSPLMLFDGVPTGDANEILRYDPLKVEKIEVVKDLFLYGGIRYPGILSFHTYQNNMEGFKLDEATTLLQYEGLQHSRIFYTPHHETSMRKPDFRTVLYWNPYVKPGETIEFSTSDLPGEYEIDIQGVDKVGKPGRLLERFTVN